MPHPSDGALPTATLPQRWLGRLTAASTDRDVVAIAREYLATWGPEELARLPMEALPGRMQDPEHIGEYAFRLTQAHLSFSGTLAESLPLDRMMAFITYASSRLAQLSAGPAKG